MYNFISLYHSIYKFICISADRLFYITCLMTTYSFLYTMHVILCFVIASYFSSNSIICVFLHGRILQGEEII